MKECSLYNAHVIKIPDQLKRAYVFELKRLGKFEEAQQHSPEKTELVGGASADETIIHFVHRFAASATRIEYLVLDPKHEFGSLPAKLKRWLAFGEVTLLDIPCGTGAGSLCLLATLGHLREKRELLPFPITINLLAADISKDALDIYYRIFTDLNPFLAMHNIQVCLELNTWDYLQPEVTAKLIDEWFKTGREEMEHIVLISAMSGPLKGKISSSDRWFNHVLERLYGRPASITWIEPATKKALNLMDKLKHFISYIPWFRALDPEWRQAQYIYLHPVKKQEIRGNLCVHHWSR